MMKMDIKAQTQRALKFQKYLAIVLSLATVATLALSAILLWPRWTDYRVARADREERSRQMALVCPTLGSLQDAYAGHDSRAVCDSLKALARTGDYRVVPILIDAMYCESDAEVLLAAHGALCVISRKFGGFGASPEEMTLKEWLDEIDRWKAWYRHVRPEAEFEDRDPLLSAEVSMDALQRRVASLMRDLKSADLESEKH